MSQKKQNTNKTVEVKKDPMVHSPSHYNKGGMEVFDIQDAFDQDRHSAAATKYILRHEHKGKPIQDIEKAIVYLQRRVKVLKEKGYKQ